MSETVQLFPRSTVTFENDNEERLLPNANSADFGATGLLCRVILGTSSTVVEESVTRVRMRGHRPNSLPAVSTSNGGGVRPVTGEQLGNKTFTLQGGAVPNVPETFAALFVDNNDSILSNGGDGTVTIDYVDDTDTPRTDSWQLSIDGKGPHYTSFPVKSVTEVEGSGFDTVGLGAPAVADTLIVGPACPDTVHDILASSGLTDAGPTYDPNSATTTDGDASYVQADATTDQRIYCGLPSISHLNVLSIVSVVFEYFFKNVAATTVGIQGLMRTDPTNPDTVVSTAFTTTGSETGAYTLRSSGTLTTNPETSAAWTLQEIENLEVGVNFLGESPTVAKRCAFIRVTVNCRVGFIHPSVDGDDLTNVDQAYLAVAKDPFTTPGSEDSQGIRVHASAQNIDLRFEMESLPSDATSVDVVETRVRYTYRHVGDKNGSAENDQPCGLGAPPRSNNVVLNQLEGPREQINLGGIFIEHNLTSQILSSRILLGPGDPDSGCGANQDYDGLDLGFGNYTESVLQSVLNSSSNPIAVSDVNSMTAGIRLAEGTIPEYRISRVYSYVQFRRNPVGESYLHLAVDDDILSPDDGTYMSSRHSADKDFGVDFSGIPEVTEIFWVEAQVRGRTTSGSSRGWSVVWKYGGEEYVEPEQTNTSFATVAYRHATSVFTGESWRRDEVNGLEIVFRAYGEAVDDYYDKDFSAVNLFVELEPIPEKVDTARRIASERLLLLGKPLPMFTARLPLYFGDVRLMDVVAVSHRALPRETSGLGFEKWDRVPMRVVEKSWDLQSDTVVLRMFDLRDYLVTFLFTAESQAKGRSFDGTMLITNGVSMTFSRATNDYIEDPFAFRLQELSADEPPMATDGVLIQNSTTNLFLNGGFGEGASNVFTNWSKTEANGGTITEDLEDLGWDPNFVNAPQRSVLFTGGNPATEVYLQQTLTLENGDGLSPEGSNYCISVYHKDDDGQPLSYALYADPPGFADHFFRPTDQTWLTAGGGGALTWGTLPVRSERTIDRIQGTLDNLETVAMSPSGPTLSVILRIGVRTVASQRNHLYGVQIEGGTLELGEERRYPSSMLLTRTGPVVRDLAVLRVPSVADNPTYYMTRGTFFCIVETTWNTSDLPEVGATRRYVYSLTLDANNHDQLYYDQDTESWVFERKVASVVYQATRFYPAVVAGRPIRLATRWISSLGDLGETAHSIAIFVDDVRGTDASPGATPTPPASADFYIGSRDAVDGTALDGKIRRVRITQQVLPPERIRRLR